MNVSHSPVGSGRARPSRHHQWSGVRVPARGRWSTTTVDHVIAWGHLAGGAPNTSPPAAALPSPAACHDQYVTRAGEEAERWYCKATHVTFLDRPSEETSRDHQGAVLDQRFFLSRRRLSHRDARCPPDRPIAEPTVAGLRRCGPTDATRCVGRSRVGPRAAGLVGPQLA